MFAFAGAPPSAERARRSAQALPSRPAAASRTQAPSKMASAIARRGPLFALGGSIALLNPSSSIQAAKTDQDTASKPPWPLSICKKQFAKLFDEGMASYERQMTKRKQKLFSNRPIAEDGIGIVEVGIGAGTNLPHYPCDSRIAGIDPNRELAPALYHH